MKNAFANIALLAAGPNMPAATQTPPVAATTASADRGCELHVWAKPYIDVDITGIFPDGALATAETAPYKEKLRRGNSNIIKDLLTPGLLLAAIKESNIGPRLNIAPDKFILESDPTTYRAFAKSPTSSDEPCRYGFTFQMVKFQKSAVYGREIIVFYNITDRTVRPKPRNMHSYNGEKISTFDPTASDDQIASVLKGGLQRAIDDIVAKKFPVITSSGN